MSNNKVKIDSKKTPTVAFITLGCKVNQYDTQVMREVLKNAGYKLVDPNEFANVYIINTCTVTSMSDRKSRQMIRRLASLNPSGIIVVTGCYAERKPDEIRQIEGVDIILSNKEKPFIDRHLNILGNPVLTQNIPDYYPCITSFDDQTRAFVKIEEGCDSFCTYCIVPYVRGGSIHSRPIDSIFHEVQSLANNGYSEIVLTGIHLGAYGKDFTDNIKLPSVLRAIHEIEGIERIRLSSIEPLDVTDELIMTVSRLKKCASHFHISLQSGSDKILRLMNRGYTSSKFKKVLTKVRSAITDVGISSDVMVGFPGETDQDFEETYNFVEEMEFSKLHVFRYSPREGTPAEKFPDQVPDRISTRRSLELISLGNRLIQKFQSKMLGKDAEILIENVREGKNKLLAGFTSNYIRVLVANATDELIGHLIPVKLVDIENSYMIGSSI